ncbi:DnaA regulatory inactivator Hda [Aestuariibacter halophilus]|uniref:DnaA regulatory inactivator Hda n=1 Tax=Fluctibacter halophilus TaxID=226011 RepID=A0ABS8G4Q1_9ALTE|nr:DnaA regulatory inactivator Hda [Aestuariibacter halophilus]MCC2615567.1 DnaA regulatory inactivator Hda [Aestuariibacter halophilus]
MAQQLSLPVQLPDGETFEQFVVGNNQAIVSHLHGLLDGPEQGTHKPITYISGERGRGKSHLLFALCHAAQQQHLNPVYIGLEGFRDMDAGVLDGLEHFGLVCVDDVDAIGDDRDWQVALFDLINRVLEIKTCQIVLCGRQQPNGLTLQLEDLRSRLTWGMGFQLQELSDDEKVDALQCRADARGMMVSADVARFLLAHVKRDMPSLMAVLDTLDDASLQEQRRLTIPFIKRVLAI